MSYLSYALASRSIILISEKANWNLIVVLNYCITVVELIVSTWWRFGFSAVLEIHAVLNVHSMEFSCLLVGETSHWERFW